VLTEIDFDYLMLWGHYRLTIDQHERLQGKVSNGNLKESSAGNLGTAYYRVGQIQKAISFYEQALSLAKERDNQTGEGVWLGNLANCFGELGQTQRAMEDFRHALDIARELERPDLEASHINNMGYYMVDLSDYARAFECHYQALTLSEQIGDQQGGSIYAANLGIRYHDRGQTEKALECCRQSLALAQEIGNRYSESVSLTYLGDIYVDQGMWDRAIEHYELALKITDEINNPQFRNLAEWGLAFTHLCAGNVTLAGLFIEEARKHEVPRTNHAVWSLAGVIFLRCGNQDKARKAFSTAIAEADSLLAHNDRNSRALDSRALALCGLTLCEMSGRYLPDASKTYYAARRITSDAGIVSRTLSLFDVLAQADTGGILADVRPTAAGVRLE
jgi:tetratricopeptide (TPR) repeat protein